MIVESVRQGCRLNSARDFEEDDDMRVESFKSLEKGCTRSECGKSVHGALASHDSVPQAPSKVNRWLHFPRN